MDGRQRRQSSREFKLVAVRLITEGNRPVSEVVPELALQLASVTLRGSPLRSLPPRAERDGSARRG